MIQGCTSLSYYQKQLDLNNINFDITDYTGITPFEAQGIVDNLIKRSKNYELIRNKQ